jgi:thioredoxin reductase (NADPH)
LHVTAHEGDAIQVHAIFRPSRAGVFAAGDVGNHPYKLKLVDTGIGDACIAVNFAKHFLDPLASVFPGHSFDMKPKLKDDPSAACCPRR